ncbi:MAG TPA: response regulator [Candidatus Dormibacteraeota bacterium]|jgi:CheY-like chemotaxis protein
MPADAPIRVLLVEDDARLQTLGRKILERHGYQVLLAGDGRVAVELAGSGRPDLVLMDVSLPEMDGLEATRLIKLDQPDLPVVALTAHAMERDRERTRDAGCDGFLSKPYQIPDLLAAVSEHLRPA